MSETVLLVVLAQLAVASLGFGYRLLRGPSIADRIVAVDGLVIIAIAAVAVDAMRRDDTSFIDVSILLGLIAFVGTAITARFIERRGA